MSGREMGPPPRAPANGSASFSFDPSPSFGPRGPDRLTAAQSSLSPAATGARACMWHSHPTGVWEPSEKRKGDPHTSTGTSWQPFPHNPLRRLCSRPGVQAAAAMSDTETETQTGRQRQTGRAPRAWAQPGGGGGRPEDHWPQPEPKGERGGRVRQPEGSQEL